MKYKRVLLKLSGEALSGDQEYGIDTNVLNSLAEEIKSVYEMGVEIGIVVGGGNIHRGVAGATKGMNRTLSDHMGMLATVINSLALQDCLQQNGVSSVVLSAIEMDKVAEPYIYRNAMKHLENNKVLIFAGGTGNPYFTTDTTAALRANEIGADIIMKATKVDGIYSQDPVKFPDAEKFDSLSYIEVLNRNIKVMDFTAVTLCMDHGIDIMVFNLFEKANIKRAILGDEIGTMVTNKE